MPWRSLPWHVLVCVVLALSEVIVAHSFFEIPELKLGWSNPAYVANKLALLLLTASIAFPILAWPRRAQLLPAWSPTLGQGAFVGATLANLLSFAVLLLARARFADFGMEAAIPAGWLWLYFTAVLATGGSLLLVAAPASLWWQMGRTAVPEILLALAVAGLVLLTGEMQREGWSTLSAGTLLLSHWLLSLFEANAVMDLGNRILGVGDFRVQIWAACSGYEGIALILAFLAVYLWVFRAHLRFPNAFCLVPIGIGAVWFLNAARIAALVSIGAHVSPEVALGGFHSWSGWIAFLIVSMGIMGAARHSAFVWAPTHSSAEPRSEEQLADHAAPALLAPFIASMATSIVASAFAPFDQWLYVLKVLAIGGTVWWYRAVYQTLNDHLFARTSFAFWPIVCGLAVGMAWIATDPQHPTQIGSWLAGLPLGLALTWLAFRAVGSVLLVPIAEELAFRGYLYRAIAALKLPHLTPAQLRFAGLLVSSLAFGVLHERWLAAALSGAVYAALLWRSGRISDPIVAHMASNGLIVLWSVCFGQWSLL